MAKENMSGGLGGLGLRAARAVAAASVFIGLGVLPAEAQSTPAEWGEAAANDLFFIQKTVQDDHAAILDPGNAAFRRAVDKAYTAARGALGLVQDARGYRAIVSRFVNQLGDPHTAVAYYKPLTQVRSAGIIAHWRVDRFIVVSAEAGSGFEAGDAITACDSAPSLRADVAHVIEAQQSSEWAYWWERLAGDYFVDFGDPQRRLPQSCTTLRNGVASVVPLRWREIDWENARPRFRSGFTEPKTGLSFSRVAPGYYWISLPTFNPGNERIRDMYKMIRDIEEREGELRSAHAVVLDLRGNSGGSTEWGDRIIDAIWGTTALKAAQAAVQKPLTGGWKWWRASVGALRMVDSFLTEAIAQDDGSGAWVRYFRNVKGAILRSLAKQESHAADPEGKILLAPESAQAHQGVDGSGIDTRVYVLTDSACFSACVLTVDKLRRIPGAVHVGAATGPHTPYGEVADVALPSGLGRLALPIAWMRAFELKPGTILSPQIKYDGEWSTGALQRWIAGL